MEKLQAWLPLSETTFFGKLNDSNGCHIALHFVFLCQISKMFSFATEDDSVPLEDKNGFQFEEQNTKTEWTKDLRKTPETKKDWRAEFLIEWANDKWFQYPHERYQSFQLFGMLEYNYGEKLRKADDIKIFWNPYIIPGYITKPNQFRALAYHLLHMKEHLETTEHDATVKERVKHNMTVLREMMKAHPDEFKAFDETESFHSFFRRHKWIST